jgi:ubiquinone biosynthesis protein
MTPIQLTRGMRSLKRVRQIARVLTQHGFGHVVARMNLARYVPAWLLRRKQADRAMADAGLGAIGRRLAAVCTELGPTFIKFGQMLTTRPDVLPAEIVRELRSLQDHVPPFDTEEARRLVSERLERPLGDCFVVFEEIPLASGSIGQVHRARTKDGVEVVVKVRRPGIEQTIRADMQLMHWLADSLETLVPELEMYRPTTIVSEFEDALMRELDFINEAAATERIGAALAGSEGLRAPTVHWDLTGPGVITLEKLPGRNALVTLEDDSLVDEIDCKLIAARMIESYLVQIFEVGTFHTDPHPGNFLIEPPGHVGLIDFGQVGTLTDEQMTQLVVMVYAAVNGEMGLVVDTLSDLGALGPQTDRFSLQRSLRMLLDKYLGLKLGHVDLGKIYHEMTDVMRSEGVTVPREVVLLIKALSMVATTARKFDPEVNVLASLKPRITEALKQRLHPSRAVRAAAISGYESLGLLQQAPRRLKEIMSQLASGTWQLNIQHRNLERLTNELDQSSSRLAFSIVIAAIIVGSSVVVTANPELRVLNIPLQFFGIFGYLVAGVFGLALAWTIFRSGRWR